MRAFCDVVHDFPNVNASVDDDALIVHHDVNLGIAVDLDFEGLVAPVIRNADGKRLRLDRARDPRPRDPRPAASSSAPTTSSAARSRSPTWARSAPTLTLPIINQPQVAILATDGDQASEPVVVEGPDGDDTIAIHHVGMLALAWDHRAFDGAYAARVPRRDAQTMLETHDWDAELA